MRLWPTISFVGKAIFLSVSGCQVSSFLYDQVRFRDYRDLYGLNKTKPTERLEGKKARNRAINSRRKFSLQKSRWKFPSIAIRDSSRVESGLKRLFNDVFFVCGPSIKCFPLRDFSIWKNDRTMEDDPCLPCTYFSLIEYSIPFTSIILFLSTFRHFILRFLPFHCLFAWTYN